MPPKKKTVKRKSTVPKTRNANTLTESQYWSKIRSALRSAFRFWKPMMIALENASRPYKGANKRIKKEYQCAHCKEWFQRKDVEIDHITQCGSLKGFEDIQGFIERLTVEDPNAFQILCKPHHKEKTISERKK
jgi:hypothetical protein